MKSKVSEFLDKSVSSMLAAIELFNKPGFNYREETVSILITNSFELILKAKWLAENKNKINSLFVYDATKTKGGEKSKKPRIKTSRSGNPITHEITFLCRGLNEKGFLDQNVISNLSSILEIRDSSIHFVNRSGAFTKRLQEVISAAVKNYVTLMKEWFDRDLEEFRFSILPLSFIDTASYEAIVLNSEERNFLNFLDTTDETENTDSNYSVSVSVDVKFTKSTTKSGLKYILSNDPDATKVTLSEPEFRERWPFNYRQLTEKLKERYSDFKENGKYHEIRKSTATDQRYTNRRFLDPAVPQGTKKDFYSPNLFSVFDQHYTRK